MACRSMTGLALSVVYFGHELQARQVGGAVLLFVGLAVKTVGDRRLERWGTYFENRFKKKE